MGKFTNDLSMDAALDFLVGTQIHVCSAQPLTRADAVTAFNLASGNISGASYTKANGSVSGRKITLAAQSGLAITTTGVATHIATTNGTILLDVTTCTSQALTSGGTVGTNAFAHEIGDPV